MKFFVIFLFFITLKLDIQAQNPVTPKSLAHLNDSNLRNMQSLLLKWQCPRFNMEGVWGNEPWEQEIRIDEKKQQLIYKIRDYNENNTDTNWMYTFNIPIMKIDSVTQNYDNNTITFYTSKSKIDVNYLNYPAIKEEKVSMYMQLVKVRNLAGQIWNNIKAYQKNSRFQ